MPQVYFDTNTFKGEVIATEAQLFAEISNARAPVGMVALPVSWGVETPVTGATFSSNPERFVAGEQQKHKHEGGNK